MPTRTWKLAFTGATIKIYLCNDLFDEVGISKCLSQLRTKMLQLFGSTIMVGAYGFFLQNLRTLIDDRADLQSFSVITELRPKFLAEYVGAIGDSRADRPNETNDEFISFPVIDIE
ncbi:hypothetical protein A6X20_20440 [Bradyrhizobium elkanii]|nr:hypothetical protein A6452_33070 [Bradyrhizobium elkanii]ODM82010.1 hypothetical protein A6X20_20440 [Bradyrhizobium elkanii]